MPALNALPAILSLLTGVAGWFYLFYSKAADRLATLEAKPTNRRRAALRRVGGVVMLLLALGFYLGFYAIDPNGWPRTFIGVWAGVVVLLGGLIILALLDIRLTFKLRGKDSRR